MRLLENGTESPKRYGHVLERSDCPHPLFEALRSDHIDYMQAFPGLLSAPPGDRGSQSTMRSATAAAFFASSLRRVGYKMGADRIMEL